MGPAERKDAGQIAGGLADAQVMIRASATVLALALHDGDVNTLSDALVCVERCLLHTAGLLQGHEGALTRLSRGEER